MNTAIYRKFKNLFSKIPLRVSSILLFVLIVFILSLSKETSSFQKFPKAGDISSREIIAPFEFDYYITDSLSAMKRQTVLESTPVKLVRRDTIADYYIQLFEDKWDSTLTIVKIDSTQDFRKELLMELWSEIPDQTIDFILSTRNLDELHTGILSRLKHFYDRGVIEDKAISDTFKSNIFSLKEGNTIKKIALSQLLIKKIALDQSYNTLLNFFDNYKEKARAATEFLDIYLVPNLKIDTKATLAMIDDKLGSIDTIAGTVRKNERIIGVHEKVTPVIAEKLEALENNMKTARRDENPYIFLLAQLGNFLLLLISTLLFFGYLYKFEKERYKRHPHFYIILCSFLVLILIAYALYSFKISLILTPLPLVAILIAMLFSMELAFVMVIFAALLIAFFQDFSMATLIFFTLTGFIAAYLFRDIKTRMNYYKPMLFLLISSLIIVFSLNMIILADIKEIFREATFALINTTLSPVIALLLLPALEKFTGVTTDLTLREYSHSDSKLLQQLSVEAPGTFYHSVLVANLAETAADAIGINSLKCRVGGLYHDVGKLSNPEYFHENQQGGSRHRKLKPHMSFLIIKNHVKEGVKIAKAHNLPQVIINIIEQHHGTALMEYFFEKASDADEKIEYEDFRYPGPKPQTKEAGLIMIADSVEAATRALEKTTHASITSTVKKVIRSKFEDAQLDQCALTLKDLDKISEKIITLLDGVYHNRQTDEIKK